MDNIRLFLFFALGLILLLLWQSWQQQNGIQQGAAPQATVAPATQDQGVPMAPTTSAVAPGAPIAGETTAVAQGARVQIQTDLIEAVVDTAGGDLRVLKLRKHPVSANRRDEPFTLMSDEAAGFYVAQSGLVGHEGNYPTHKVRFEAGAGRYELGKDAAELRVPLTYRAPNGVRYTKTYVFHRDNYVIDVEFTVDNTTRKPWQGYFYGQLVRNGVEQPGMFAVPTYTGGAIYTPTDKYQKVSFDDMRGKPLKREVSGGWVAMLQHYFVSAWMPAADARNQFWTDAREGNRFAIGLTALDPVTVAPGERGTLRGQLYAGTKEQVRLAKLVPGMDLTVDYGALTIIAAPLFWLLDMIHRFIGNWGWAIVALTILIKLAFYPLSAASYRSMAHMKKVAPKMQALKERHADDRQKLNQAMMELYKTEKINPLGGCLPIVIQIPVFIALYWVLLESVEMRQAPWVGWIRDLSIPDQYYVLPIIMGITMYAQQMLNPQPMDPIQKKVFMVMPAMFTIFFLFFPAGLVLYWTVNNLLSIAQQWQINRSLGVASG